MAERGRLERIILRSSRRGPACAVERAEAVLDDGLVGDRFESRPGGAGTRQVTLIQHEHLARIGERLGVEPVDALLVRRNLVVSGLELASLRERRFRVGQVELQGTGGCPPCDQMEQLLGPGGRAAMQGLGGLTARVISPGQLATGDEVVDLGPVEPPG